MAEPAVKVVLYGRFQPVHLGHVAMYKHLTKKFGAQSVYIGTSNKTDPDTSPLPFEWKKKLWAKHGVSADRVLQTRQNYNADELASSLGKSKDAFVMVVAVGKKDASRLKNSKFFSEFPTTGKNLQRADTAGYYYIIPNITMDDAVMNASAIRDVLRHSELDGSDMNFLTKQMGLKKRELLQLKQLFEHQLRKKWWAFLVEAGAAGHMMHPFEDLTMTFGDMKAIITAAFDGKLELAAEGPITEKVDGQNLFATIRDGSLLFARNKSQLKSRGSAALSLNDFAARWKDIPEVKAAYTQAGLALQKGLMSLSATDKEAIFKNGRNWVNFEVISHENPNTINYDSDVIIFHNIQMVDDSGSQTGPAKGAQKKLFSIFSNAEKSAQLSMKIQPPQIVKLNKPSKVNFGGDQKQFISTINSLMSKHKLSDRSTLGDYLEAIYTVELRKLEDKHAVTLKSDLRKKLLNRLSRGDKSYRITSLPSDVADAGMIDDIKKLDSDSANQVKTYLQPIEDLILKFSIVLLKNIDTFLSANPDAAVQQLRKNIDSQISAIRSSKNVEDINKMMGILEKIQSLGGFDNLVPSEGIVFRYRGKIYKLTGLFTPVHRLMSIGRFA